MASGGWGTGAEEPGIVDKKDFKELNEAPKLLPKPTRHVRERDREDVQKQLLSLMQQEDDYLDLTFQSIAKRIKDKLTPEQRDDLVDEMFLLVSKHIRESKNLSIPQQHQHSQLPQATTWGWGKLSLQSPRFHHPCKGCQCKLRQWKTLFEFYSTMM